MSGRVAIVGGGVAGLAIGRALATDRSAPEVAIFEAGARPGGLVRTERAEGFLFEHGPSGFLDDAPGTVALAADLGLSDQLVASEEAARRRYVFRKGRLRALPMSPASAFTSGILSPAGLIRVLGEPLVRDRASGDETVHAFAARRFGGEAADVLADAIASGIFGGDARQLSLKACFPSIAEMEAGHGSLFKAMRAARRERGDRPRRRGRLTSFREGMGTLVDALARELGGRVQTSATVERLEPVGGGYQLTLADGRSERADAVVLTAGVAVSSALLGAVDRPLAETVAAIPTAPMVTVGLGYESSAIGRRLDGFGFLAPRTAGLRLLGVLWESSIFPDRAPSGHVLLRVMLGGATDPEAATLDEERLLTRVRAELRTSMRVNGTPRFVRLARHRVGIPQYIVGHTDRLARIDAALAAHPRLFVGGHGFRGVGVNACIAEAQPLAARVIAALGGRAAA